MFLLLFLLFYYCAYLFWSTSREPVVTLDIFQNDVAYIRWWKWFTETGQTITGTGQPDDYLYYLLELY